MNMEKNKFYKFEIKDWSIQNEILGILIQEASDWILIRPLLVNYMLDGLMFVNRKYITSISRGYNEILSENILKSNGQLNFVPDLEIELTNEFIFKYLFEEQIMIEVQLRDDSIAYFGCIKKICPKSFYLKLMDSKGHWLDYSYLFRYETIRSIEINSNYINSLLAYNKSLENKSDINEYSAGGYNLLYSFKVKSWDERILGILINESTDWILIKPIIDDFILDGLILLHKKFVISQRRKKYEVYVENVLKACNHFNINIDVDLKESLIRDPLFYLFEKKILFQITNINQHRFAVGYVDKSPENNHIYLKGIHPDGTWIKNLVQYKINSIRSIGINNIYLKSLLVYRKEVY